MVFRRDFGSFYSIPSTYAWMADSSGITCLLVIHHLAAFIVLSLGLPEGIPGPECG